MGNVLRCCLSLLATSIFMSKLSVADLRGILSRIFEHLSVIKIKQVSRFFCVQKQEILYNNLFYFTRNKLWWWTNKTPSALFVYSLVPPLVFALLEYFAKFSKIYTSSGRQRFKTKPDQNLLDCGQMVWFQHSTMSDFI